MFLYMLGSPAHESSDRSRRSVEDVHTVFFAVAPETILVRPIRSTLIHYTRSTISQGTVDNVRMASYPSDISGTPVDILVLNIEDPLVSRRYSNHVAGSRVHDPFRLSRSAGRVQYVQNILGVHRLRRTITIGFFHEIIPPIVPAFY